ncbi:MAG: hypothetical protein QW753_04810 [Thermofilum sp.]
MVDPLEVVDGLVMVAVDGNPYKCLERLLFTLGEVRSSSRVWLTEGLYDIVVELDGVTYGALLRLVSSIRRFVDGVLSVDWVVKRHAVYKGVPPDSG